jgi:hypothetical protein
MKKNLLVGNKNFQYFTLITVLLLFPFLKGVAQSISLTTLGVAYTQNFDGLANSGTSSTVPAGWAFVETGSGLNTNYTAGTGSGTSGDTYSFGSSAASDRAFGTLQSGSVNSTLGASFTNGTGSTITSLDISYIGEQWRLGATGRIDRLNFEYSLNATSLSNGTWTPVTTLNFVAPVTTGALGALDGNLTANRTTIASTIGSLSIAVGGTVWIRWTDFNPSGSDDGLGIDDFSLTPNATAPAAPTKLVITSINPSSPLAGSSFSVMVQSQDGSNAPQNVSQNTTFSLTTNLNAGAIGGTITGTIPSGANSVTVTGVTLPNAGTGVTITASITSGDNLSNGVSSTFNVIGVATQLAFVGTPALGFQSTNMASFKVEARRADGSVDNNYTGQVNVSKGNGPGNLTGTTSVNAVAGVATFSALQFDQIGVYTLNANSGLLTQAISPSITISSNPVTWNFTSGTAAATGVPANLTVSVLSQGNNNGTTTLVNGTSASSGYPGASGTFNAGAAARTLALVTGSNGSAYFEFTLTPSSNNSVILKGLTFGSRSTSTGPQAFSILSSADNFASVISTGILLNNGTWALSSPSFSTTSSGVASPITFRIYGHNGSGTASPNTANWRVDDILLDLDVQPCSQPTINVNSGAICTGNSFTINPTGGVSYSVTGNSFTVSPTVPTSYTVTGVDAVGCTNTVVSTVAVNSLPTVTITGTPTVCLGYATALTASGANTYVWSNGPTTAINNVTPTGNTTYSVIGTDGNGCSNTASINTFTFACVPSTSLQAAYCGTTLTTLSDRLKCIMVPNTTKYEWQVTDLSTNTVYLKQSANNLVDMYLSYIPQVVFNKTYSIRVRAFSNGIWGVFSNSCSVTTPASSATKLQTAFCSTTLTTLSDRLRCDLVPNTTRYEWKITDIATSTSYTIQSAGNTNNIDMYLSYIPQVTYNKTYSIEVRALTGGIWGNFGTACNVTTPAAALTKLQTAFCSTTLTTLSDRLRCDLVPNTTKYEWQVTDISTSTVYTVQSSGNTNNIDMYLSYIPQVTFNKSYSIKVRAYSAGIWGNFGQSCIVTTPPSSVARFAFSNTEETEIGSGIIVNAYPNPTTETLNVDFDNMPANASVEIYSMIGELVLSQPLTDMNNTINTTQLANGLYHAKVIGNNKLLFAQKIVKQ